MGRVALACDDGGTMSTPLSVRRAYRDTSAPVAGGVAAMDQRTQYTLDVDGSTIELVTFKSDVRAALEEAIRLMIAQADQASS